MKTLRLAGFFVALALVACSADDPVPSSSPAPVAETPAAVTEPGPAPAPAPTTSATTPPVVIAPPKKDPAPKAYEPSDIADLALWLRADDASVVADEASAVQSWTDHSKNKLVAKPFGATAPVHSGLTGSETRGIAFDGKQAMTISDDAALQWGGDFTVIVIAASKQPNGSYGALFGKTAVAAPYAGPAMFVNYAGKEQDTHRFSGQIDLANFATSYEDNLDTDTPTMFALIRMGDIVYASVNRHQPGSKDVVKAQDTKGMGIDAFIGGHPQGKVIVQGFTGTIFEVIAAPRPIVDDELDSVFDYADKRYGISPT